MYKVYIVCTENDLMPFTDDIKQQFFCSCVRYKHAQKHETLSKKRALDLDQELQETK